MKAKLNARGSKKTVLIVDSDEQILKLIVAIFANNDYKILTESSGEKALQQAREFQDDIHVLLSEFQMPGMSGLELATALTADRPKVKVLLMSSYTGGTLVLNEGWHFLPKPFVASQLRALVTTLIEPAKKSRYQK